MTLQRSTLSLSPGAEPLVGGTSHRSERALEPTGAHDRVQSEQLKVLFRNTPVGVLGAMIGGLILAYVLLLHDGVSFDTVSTWAAVLVAVAFSHLVLCWIYWRVALPARLPTLALIFTLISLLEGIIWGAGSVLLVSPSRIELQLWVMIVTSAVASGAASAFGSYLPAFYALLFPAMLPYPVWAVLHGGILSHALMVLDLLYVVAMAALGWRSNRGLVEALRLRFENIDLLVEVRNEKERAEQASRDKSRFLAAASHDLRQPVHALTMFLGAMQNCSLDAPARQILGHIDESVSALDGLFTSLLDISRLDAGVVQSDSRAFHIHPLVERIVRDYDEEAARKGIALVVQPCSLAVLADPILLERVLRNLVSNAVRYTDRGRVVIGCRRGRRLSIEVWDTGKGIPGEEQQRIFQEYYQLGNAERDRAMGLGLGLAIVKRLAELMACPLALKSRPGKGSVFAISVPIAAAAPEQPAAAPGPSRGAMVSGLILVVDDETAIQSAMQSLLASWGHEVIVAESCAQMLDKVATCPRQPDLIICDYRLRQGENGIATIQRLQSEYNEDIPALLITGDTAPDRLKEARESGFLLLHKPLHNSKLRAAITNLLAQGARALPPEGDARVRSGSPGAPRSPPGCG